jgi:Rrf2 family protein
MLGLSVKGKYAVAAIVDLAQHAQLGPVQIKSIAERHQIPQNYLERLLTELKRAGIVTSYRGSQGGYELRKRPEEIRIYDILSYMEGPVNLSDGHKGCEKLDSFWKIMDDRVKDAFNLTIAECIALKEKEEKLVTFAI